MRVPYWIGPTIGLIVIVLFMANMIYLHIAINACAAQNAPGTHHDWKAIIDNIK